MCGASVPLFGGVALDLCGLAGIGDVDESSLVADLRAGTFGPDVESGLRDGYGLTLGHWPQSMDLSTVGGWLACRGAGQYSNRYGKIEDMVLGLEVVLADGRIVRTGGTGPRSATGPDLTQLFVGSEGTLGVITEGRFRVHPVPEGEGRRSVGFDSFADGLDACRRILRRGASPAVLRLYDATESGRNFDQPGTNVLIVLDEADPALLGATLDVVDQECVGATPLDVGLVDRWLTHRNDVSALAPLWRSGVVVDTVEVSARWTALPGLYAAVLDALAGVDGTLVASSHQSHAYTDGACLYFTFAGRPPDGSSGDGRDAWISDYYRRAWDEVTRATIDAGGAISHHHGIGLNRARFLADGLGAAFAVSDLDEGCPRPPWHPQPRQARSAHRLRAGALAVSILVVDVGTSGVRGAVVRPDATVEHIHHVPVLPDSPFPGLVEFDGLAIASAVADVAARSLADGGPVDAVGIANQRASTLVWDRATGIPVGPGLGWQDLRTVGTCLELQGQGIRIAPNASATKLAAILDVADPDRSRSERGELAFGTIDTWVAWILSDGAAARHRRLQRRRDRPAPRRRVEAGARSCSSALRIPAAVLPTIVDSSGARRRCVDPGRRTPDRRHGRGPAGLPHRAELHIGRPGQGHLRHRRHARPVHRSRPSAPGRPGAGRDHPDHRLAPRRADHVGLEAIMLSAGTCVEWLRDDLGIIDDAADSATVAAGCDDTGDVWFVPALLGLGTPVWDFGARGTLCGLTRGSGRRRDRPSRPRGRGSPGTPTSWRPPSPTPDCRSASCGSTAA